MDKIKEKMWGAIIGFFLAALLCYIGAALLADVWWILLIVAIIAAGIIIYIRFKKGKPKY
jgi:Na+-driven multidrug efflux pump